MLSQLMPKSVFRNICFSDLYLDDKLWNLNADQLNSVYACANLISLLFLLLVNSNANSKHSKRYLVIPHLMPTKFLN